MNKLKKGFTLIEALIVTVIVSIIFIMVISLYFRMMKTKVGVSARQSLIENSYYMFERLNVLIKDYDIDYEEYFNRRIVGCDNDKAPNFSWDVGDNGYCDTFSTYGNASWKNDDWNIYYCSSETTEFNSSNYVNKNSNISNGEGCWNNTTPISTKNSVQSFGQYEQQFWDRKSDTDGTGGVVNDDDDLDLGKGPTSIANSSGVQELYLISDDNERRLFIRRNYIGSGDWDNDGTAASGDIEKLYTLEMLKLRGFDAGKDHVFGGATPSEKEGLYDGKIDTWACNYGKGYNCGGLDTEYGGTTNKYNLPIDVNDGWTKVFGKDITITDWNIKIYPIKDSDYAWMEDSMQMNPYISIQMKTKLYGEPWSWKINPEILDNYQLDLQTTFNIRNNY